METICTTDITPLIQTGKVMIEFYGDGCLNCQMMTPVLNQLEYIMPNVRFYRINVDICKNLIHQFNINSLPTLLLFHNGQLLLKTIGVKTVDTLRKLICDTLNCA